MKHDKEIVLTCLSNSPHLCLHLWDLLEKLQDLKDLLSSCVANILQADITDTF